MLDVVTGASTLGSALRITSTGAATSTTIGHLLQLVDDSNALGIGVNMSFDGLTTGEGVNIQHTSSVIADGGSLFRLESTGIDTGGATAGTVLDVSSTAQLAGTVARFDSILTTGTALDIISTGIYTGSVGVLRVSASAATSGNIAVIDGTGLTSGTGLLINATTATLLDTGFYFRCFDGAANDFTISDFGATVITGTAAGTAALTLTTGDILVSQGATRLIRNADNVLSVTQTADAASSQVALFQGDRATPADADAAYITLSLSDSAGNQREQARISWAAPTVLTGATGDGSMTISALLNNTLTTMLTIGGTSGNIVHNVNSTFAGTTIADLGTVTTANIDGGTLDAAVIGGASAAAITGTTITGNTSVSTPTITAAATQTFSATSLTFSQTVPTVGTGFDGAAQARWLPYGLHGASGMRVTEFFFDLTNLVNSTTANDIIGETATANCHFGQITAAIHGAVEGIEVICLETPAGGDPDIDLYSATESTGTENALVTDLTETLLLARAASWANGDVRGATVMPAASQYLYLAVGSAGGAPGTYSAGKFLVRIFGT